MGVCTAATHRHLSDMFDRTLGRLATLPESSARLLIAPLVVHLAFRGASTTELSAYAERALADGQLVRSLLATSSLPYPPMVMLSYADRAQAAEHALDEAFTYTSGRASVVGLVLSSGFRALVRLRRGNLAGAQADAETCLELALGAGLARFDRLAVAMLITVFVEQGRINDAQDALNRLPRIPIDDPDGPPAGSLLRESCGWLRLARGDSHGALAHFEPIRRWEQEFGATGGVASVLADRRGHGAPADGPAHRSAIAGSRTTDPRLSLRCRISHRCRAAHARADLAENHRVEVSGTAMFTSRY